MRQEAVYRGARWDSSRICIPANLHSRADDTLLLHKKAKFCSDSLPDVDVCGLVSFDAKRGGIALSLGPGDVQARSILHWAKDQTLLDSQPGMGATHCFCSSQ